MTITNGASIPLSICVTSATPPEVKLVKESLAARLVKGLPKWLIDNGAYDSDPLVRELAKRNIEMIAPHKKNRRQRTRTQDGRALRRYKKR